MSENFRIKQRQYYLYGIFNVNGKCMNNDSYYKNNGTFNCLLKKTG